MAVVRGPLHSDGASGQFGKTVVYAESNGQHVCRPYKYVDNVQNAKAKRSSGILQSFAFMFATINRFNLALFREEPLASPIIPYFARFAKPGQVWSHALAQFMFGKGFGLMAEPLATFEALPFNIKQFWDTVYDINFFDPIIVPHNGVVYRIGQLGIILQFGFFRAGFANFRGGLIPSSLFPFPRSMASPTQGEVDKMMPGIMARHEKMMMEFNDVNG